MYSSWRRLTVEASTERLVEPANERMLAEAIARASSSKCRYDESPSFKCEYKTEPNARLTAGGAAHEFHHFLVDFAPRVLHAMDADGCSEATLSLPGYYPHNRPFRLTAARRHLTRHGWDDALSPSHVARGTWLYNRSGEEATAGPSTVEQAAFLFGAHATHRLHVRLVLSEKELCEQPGQLLTFSPYLFEWGMQPIPWLTSFRRLAWAAAGVSPVAPCSRGQREDGGRGSDCTTRSHVLVVQRLLTRRSASGARALPNELLAQTSAYLGSRRIGHSVMALEGLSLVQQVRLFSMSTVVMGVHGAGLSNILFCPAGTAVIEMGNQGPYNGSGPMPVFVNLAHRLHFHYHRHPRLELSPRLMKLLSFYTEPPDPPAAPLALPPCDSWCGTGILRP